MTPLQQRISEARAEQQEQILCVVADALYTRNLEPETYEYSKFERMLDAGAYLDAAMLLRSPDKPYIGLEQFSDGWYCLIAESSKHPAARWDQAPTAALALLGAICRARGL